MMTQRCADPTFNLNDQALAVLALLAGREPDFADYDTEMREYKVRIETYPWYNGRERGVCLTVRSWEPGGRVLHIAFAEQRSADGIFIEVWEQADPAFNGPTLESRAEALTEEENDLVSSNRHVVPCGRCDLAVSYIMKRMADFYETWVRVKATAEETDAVAPTAEQATRLIGPDNNVVKLLTKGGV